MAAQQTHLRKIRVLCDDGEQVFGRMTPDIIIHSPFEADEADMGRPRKIFRWA